jgi:MscS family membrane protein
MFRTAWLTLGLLTTVQSWSQTPPSPAERKEPGTPIDPLGRTTPRSTVFNFLSAAQKGDFETAARYLNTRKLGHDAVILAQQLFDILDRYLPPKLNQVSDSPEGSLTYPASPDRDLVGTITIDDESLDILVDRIDRGKAGSIWLFSSKTLAAIPDVHESISTVRPESFIPKVLIETRFLAIALYQWLAVFLGLPLLYFALSLLNSALSRLVGRVRRRLGSATGSSNPDIVPIPLRLLIIAAIIRWLLAQISLPLLARQFWLQVSITMAVGAAVWILILLNGVAEAHIRLRFGRKDLPGTLSILRFVRRLVDAFVLVLGVLVLLQHFGLNVATAVAGLGVGGIAVALAAQKTLENVIAGVSLIFDQTVRLGDLLKLGDTFGSVEWIGLRSISIRTLHRTVVSVPNGQVASASLENFSSRDKFWFNHILGLTYSTSAQQLGAIINEITDTLTREERIDRDSVRVSFLRFGESSLDVELFAYVFANDMVHFFGIQQRLLLKVMEIVQAAGTEIAFPSRTLYLAKSGTEVDAAATRMPAPTAMWRPSGRVS